MARRSEHNFNGALNSCRAVLPNMIERRSGKIIVLACGGVSTGRPGFSFTRRRRQLGEIRRERVRGSDRTQRSDQLPFTGESYTHMTDQILAAGE